MSRIGILVVDDHPLFRRGVRMGLESERDLLIVAEAADGPATVAEELLGELLGRDPQPRREHEGEALAG